MEKTILITVATAASTAVVANLAYDGIKRAIFRRKIRKSAQDFMEYVSAILAEEARKREEAKKPFFKRLFKK